MNDFKEFKKTERINTIKNMFNNNFFTFIKDYPFAIIGIVLLAFGAIYGLNTLWLLNSRIFTITYSVVSGVLLFATSIAISCNASYSDKNMVIINKIMKLNFIIHFILLSLLGLGILIF